MQVMNTLFPAMGQAGGVFSEAKSGTEKKTSDFFQSLLPSNDKDQPKDELASLLQGMSVEDLAALMLGKVDNGNSLEDIIAGLDSDRIDDLLHDHPAFTEVHLLLSDLINFSKMDKGTEKDLAAAAFIANLKKIDSESSGTLGNLAATTMQQQMTVHVDEANPNQLKNEMKSVLKELASLLKSYQTENDFHQRDAAKLTALLKQWSTLMRQGKNAGVDALKLQHDMLDEEESSMLDELVQRNDKRSFYAGKNMYAQDATVTKQDVLNWLQQASDNQAQQAGHPVQQSGTAQQMPMAKVEQHVIHLENTGRVERVGSELVHKFANIIQESQFISQKNGKLELNFMLQPNQLGNINVKMTQVNGEMIVKMLVSSQAAKDMLEQNIHQLRHLFSPHQVSVERNEVVSDEEFYSDEQEEGQEQDESSKEEHEDGRHQERNRSEFDFETIFNQVSEEGER